MNTAYTNWIRHSARIAVAASLSLAAAGLLTLPESYWAPLTTIIVMESTLGAAWAISKIRLIGTAIGASAGCALALCLNPGPLTFGIGLFVLGLLCAALRLNRSAYRFAGITLAIVFLVARGRAPWLIAVHRFVEVSMGIAVALIMTAIWPEPQQPAAGAR
ncbi:MAG TPA: FUSC family protein [Phycisphaerae bacterium]|nr:FUSC family protein [Phycisphaerae bacterium]